MKKNCTHTYKAIRFCQLSRKRYAIFQSLGRCVNIGVLKSETANVSLSKQSDDRTHFSEKTSFESGEKQDFDTGDITPPVQNLLNLIVLTSEPAAYNGNSRHIYNIT